MFLGVIEMSLYFAYGSNLDVEQMKRRCPESKVLVPDNNTTKGQS